MFNSECLFVCISFFILGIKANLAPFITPCTWQDSACILQSAIAALPYLANGVSELDLQSGDPLSLNDVVADRGDLKLRFNNATVTGIKQCTFVEIIRKDGGKSGSLTADCPVTVIGLYVIDGLLLVKVEGNGPFEIKTDKIRIHVDFTLKLYKAKDGKEHYKVAGFDYKYEPIERIHIHLENMYKGNQSQAEPVLALLNENWKFIVADLGKPLFQEILKKLIHIVDSLFRKVPAEELEIAS